MVDLRETFHPVAKPSRIENRKVVDWVVNERDGVCLYCLEGVKGSAGLDPHHIKSKGSGGDDVPRNLITLCREHHQMAQENKIEAAELKAILTKRFGYEYED